MSTKPTRPLDYAIIKFTSSAPGIDLSVCHVGRSTLSGQGMANWQCQALQVMVSIIIALHAVRPAVAECILHGEIANFENFFPKSPKSQ